jgi:hypothetical protein
MKSTFLVTQDVTTTLPPAKDKATGKVKVDPFTQKEVEGRVTRRLVLCEVGENTLADTIELELSDPKEHPWPTEPILRRVVEVSFQRIEMRKGVKDGTPWSILEVRGWITGGKPRALQIV